MSKPLLPVSASSSTPSHIAPSLSQWGTRTVALLLGAGVLLLIIALFRRSRSDESTPPPLSRAVPSWDAVLARKHSSGMTHQSRTCLNETLQLPFDRSAEGRFNVALSLLFPELTLSRSAVLTVRGSYQDKEFFVHKVKINDLSPIQFLMPNLPFQEKMKLEFEIDDSINKNTKTIESSINYETGFHDIEGSKWDQKPLPTETISVTPQLPHPLLITPSSNFNLLLLDNYEIQIDEYPSHSPGIVIHGHPFNPVIYLKIVHKDTDSGQEVAIALPFFSTRETILFSPEELIVRWQSAYYQAKGKEIPPDIVPCLTDIKFIICKEGRR